MVIRGVQKLLLFPLHGASRCGMISAAPVRSSRQLKAYKWVIKQIHLNISFHDETPCNAVEKDSSLRKALPSFGYPMI